MKHTPSTRVGWRRCRAPRGMTLIEIMVVITLMALVAGAVGVVVLNQRDTAMVKVARTQAMELAKALDSYRSLTGHYPSNAEGLAVLTEGGPERRVLDALPTDPWGNAYEYLRPGMHNGRFDIRSRGPDGLEGTEDDVGNWPHKVAAR